VSASAAVVVLAVLASLTACGGDDETTTVTVTEPQGSGSAPAPPSTSRPPTGARSVVVVTSGASLNDTDAGFGVVLRNNADQDALNVLVSINVLNEAGGIAHSNEAWPVDMPAKSNFYLGDLTNDFPRGESFGKLDIAVQADEFAAPGSIVLPELRNVRLDTNEYGDLVVRGELENTLDKPIGGGVAIPGELTLFAVIFDAEGNVLGGGFESEGRTVLPGRAIAFEIREGVDDVGPREASTAKVSVAVDW